MYLTHSGGIVATSTRKTNRVKCASGSDTKHLYMKGRKMSRVIINTGKVLNTIPPENYGQFAEHLGHYCLRWCVCGWGKWDPKRARHSPGRVVSALKHIQVPVIRWPGGCFADEYRGKMELVPSRNGLWWTPNWGGIVEDNSFGTHEFLDLCETGRGCSIYKRKCRLRRSPGDAGVDRIYYMRRREFNFGKIDLRTVVPNHGNWSGLV